MSALKDIRAIDSRAYQLDRSHMTFPTRLDSRTNTVTRDVIAHKLIMYSLFFKTDPYHRCRPCRWEQGMNQARQSVNTTL